MRDLSPEARVNFRELPNKRLSSMEKSGYVTNSKKYDGLGYKFYQGWNVDNPKRTEYRDLYYPGKSFHKSTGRLSPITLRKSLGESLPFQIISKKSFPFKF